MISHIIDKDTWMMRWSYKIIKSADYVVILVGWEITSMNLWEKIPLRKSFVLHVVRNEEDPHCSLPL